MQKLPMVLAFLVACGAERAPREGGGTRDVPSVSEGEGEGEGQGPADVTPPGVRPEADAVRLLAQVVVDGGVTAAAVDGASLLTCEGGQPRIRPLSDLEAVSDSAGDCPDPPARRAVGQRRTFEARGADGLWWDHGASDLNTRAGAFDVLVPGDDDRYALVASWDRILLVDIESEGGPVIRATEWLDDVVVTGLVADGQGGAIAFGPGGLLHVAVDPARSGPDLWFDQPWVPVVRHDDGSGQRQLKLFNLGTEPLTIYSVSGDPGLLTADIMTLAFDEQTPPEGVLAILAPGERALLTVTLAAGGAEGVLEGNLSFISDDPDTPELLLAVRAGITPLVPGDRAPEFDLSDLDGKRVRLSELRGRVVHLKIFNGL